MKFVNSLDEIRNNIKVIEDYLASNDNDEVAYAKGLIKRGICFIVVKYKNGYHFYPSRFIGYSNNTIDKHERNYEKDGKETNPVISKILNSRPAFDEELEDIYKDYCEILGFNASKRRRKYWVLSE